jgi:hypothetical protein
MGETVWRLVKLGVILKELQRIVMRMDGTPRMGMAIFVEGCCKVMDGM